MEENNIEEVNNNRTKIVESFKRYITQTAREFNCYSDDIIYIIDDAIDVWRNQGNLC